VLIKTFLSIRILHIWNHHIIVFFPEHLRSLFLSVLWHEALSATVTNFGGKFQRNFLQNAFRNNHHPLRQNMGNVFCLLRKTNFPLAKIRFICRHVLLWNVVRGLEQTLARRQTCWPVSCSSHTHVCLLHGDHSSLNTPFRFLFLNLTCRRWFWRKRKVPSFVLRTSLHF